MKIIYIAEDGTQFDNEMECEDYENYITHYSITAIDYLDENGKNLIFKAKSYYDDMIYNESHIVVIHNEKEFNDFKWLVGYCGWCEMETITGPGTWKYLYSSSGNSKFVKIS